jgi:hypothetical protein
MKTIKSFLACVALVAVSMGVSPTAVSAAKKFRLTAIEGSGECGGSVTVGSLSGPSVFEFDHTASGNTNARVGIDGTTYAVRQVSWGGTESRPRFTFSAKSVTVKFRAIRSVAEEDGISNPGTLTVTKGSLSTSVSGVLYQGC